MAFEVSPGVYYREFDLSNYAPALSTTQFAVVGTASKGPVNIRTLITSREHLARIFGYSTDHQGLYAAEKYLDEGNQLWYVRVGTSSGADALATATTTIGSVTVSSKTEGTFMNDVIAVVRNSSPRLTSASDEGDGTQTVFPFTLAANLVPGTVSVKVNGTEVANNVANPAVIAGTGISGTVTPSTGAVSVTFGTAPALGDDIVVDAQYYSTWGLDLVKTINAREYVLESYKGLNFAVGTENYYATALARSELIALPTFTTMPTPGSYTFTGGKDGILGITDIDYIGINTGVGSTGLQLFSDPEAVDVNSIAVPGVTTDAVVQALVTIAMTRRDCVAIVDPPFGLLPEEVVDWIDGAGAWAAQNSINTSYATVFYPWIKIADPYTGADKWIAPSGFVAAAFARTDKTRDIYYAPFGPERGYLLGSRGTERLLNQGHRDFLYENRVNPIADFSAKGILLWGQKTTQVIASDLDRLHARRTLNYIEKVLVTALYPLVGEPNNQYTQARAVAIAQPFLDGFVARGALYSALAKCDAQTNPPDVVSQNRMVINIFLQIVKTAEIIQANFILLPTGAQVEEYVGRQFI